MPTSYTQKRRLVEELGSSVEVLVMGSSHAYRGISPRHLGREGINLANSGQDLYEDSQLFARAANMLPNLKHVIITVSYFTLSKENDAHTRGSFYYKVWGIKPADSTARRDPRTFSFFYCYGNRQALKYLFRGFKPDAAIPWENRGWHENSKETGAKDFQRLARERVATHHDLMDDKNVPANVERLEKLVEQCRRRGIEPVVVVPPMTSHYRNYCDPEKIAFMRETIGDLCRRHGVRRLDYFSDPRFDLQDFSDSDHLNRSGAIKLSRAIGEELSWVPRESHVSHPGGILLQTAGDLPHGLP